MFLLKTMHEMKITVQQVCALLHCLKMMLGVSANQNEGLQCKIKNANRGVVERELYTMGVSGVSELL